MSTLPPSSPDKEKERYTVGTLHYTKATLTGLFLFLLCGDFCFTLMETVVPSILPLKFNAIGAPNWVVGLAVVTIPNMINMTVNPWFSFRSDRFRSKWGRRIPFLAGATPLLVFFLVLLGYSEPIGKWIQSAILNGSISENTVLIAVLGFFMVCFSFFNLFVSTSYYCLFNDVVPHAFLTRFMALFRMVGLGASAVYNYFLLKYANTHMKEIFVGSGILYLIAFIFLCWKVREGNYPEPSPNIGNRKGFFAAAKTYVVECFTHRFYWYIFLSSACVAMTWASGAYNILYQTKYLGVDLGFVGKINGICAIVGIFLLYPAASLADRIHPLRVLLIGMTMQTLIGPLSITYAMTRPFMSNEMVQTIFITMSILWLPITALVGTAETPTIMRLLPLDRYAQFGSANALIRSAGMIIGGFGCGAFLDIMRTLHPSPEYCYRFLSVWGFAFQFGAALFMFLLYFEWKKLGMKENLTPEMLDQGKPSARE